MTLRAQKTLLRKERLSREKIISFTNHLQKEG